MRNRDSRRPAPAEVVTPGEDGPCTTPAAPIGAPDTAFRDAQYDAVYPDGISNHYWQRARGALVARRLRAEADPDGLVVDVGCGRGGEVLMLRSRGFDCLGVELSSPRPVPGAEPYVFPGTSPDELPPEVRTRCRTILALDVVEHVPEPGPFLASLVRAFPNASLLLLTIPARQELWSNYDEHFGHVKRYGKDDLAPLLQSTGGTIRSARYLFHLLYPVAWLMAAFSIRRSTQVLAPSPGRALLHKLVSSYFVAEGLLVPGSLFGTSLLVTISLARAGGPSPDGPRSDGLPRC
jgi:SAM-dependent methyltransferase